MSEDEAVRVVSNPHLYSGLKVIAARQKLSAM